MLCCIFSFNGLVAIGSSILTIYAVKKWFSGGSCKSKARLDSKTVIITGANTGIGKETARDFVRRGARVIMACRDVNKAEISAAEIKLNATNDGCVIVKKLDLASFKSIREFCQDILDNEPKIDILVNNAGVMSCPELKTEDGLELQIGVNHFGHFLLTNLLLDRIKLSTSARIVVLSSRAHFKGVMNFNNINLTGEYENNKAYRQSKLANVIFARELAKRVKDSGVSVFSLHPGVIITNLWQYINKDYPFLIRIISLFEPIFMKTVQEGAQTTIYCSVQENIEHKTGSYFSDCKVQKPSSHALDDNAAKQLWDLSEKITKLC